MKSLKAISCLNAVVAQRQGEADEHSLAEASRLKVEETRSSLKQPRLVDVFGEA
jgi:hypothetical protein